MSAFIPLLVTTAAGVAMIRLGLKQGLLQARRPPRRCPSCGRSIAGRVCAACVGNPRLKE